MSVLHVSQSKVPHLPHISQSKLSYLLHVCQSKLPYLPHVSQSKLPNRLHVSQFKLPYLLHLISWGSTLSSRRLDSAGLKPSTDIAPGISDLRFWKQRPLCLSSGQHQDSDNNLDCSVFQPFGSEL